MSNGPEAGSSKSGPRTRLRRAGSKVSSGADARSVAMLTRFVAPFSVSPTWRHISLVLTVVTLLIAAVLI
jgi:hypothetical protein